MAALSDRSEELIDDLYDAVFTGDRNGVVTAVTALIATGVAPDIILYDGMIPAIQEVGKQFEVGKACERLETVVDTTAAGDSFNAAYLAARLRGAASEAAARAGHRLARAVIGTVKSDIHDIGKNMVAMMWEGAGFEVVDLGVNVPPQKFVDAVQNGARLVGISALLTTTMTNIPMTIQALQDAGLREQVKIMIGGAPITAEFAQQVGADGYAADANKAVAVAKQLLGLA